MEKKKGKERKREGKKCKSIIYMYIQYEAQTVKCKVSWSCLQGKSVIQKEIV